MPLSIGTLIMAKLILIFISSALIASAINAETLAVESNKTQRVTPGILMSDVLKLESGYTGNVLGAQVLDVTATEDHDVQLVEVQIDIEPEKVDRVQVISTAGVPIKTDRKAQILRDYEQNNVGIKLYLPRQKGWQFKLRLIDEDAAGIQ